MSQIENVTDDIFKIVLPTPFPVGPVNIYLIKGEVLTLVDTGPKTKEAWNDLKAALSEIGITEQDIEQIVLTHHHPDHVGSLDFFDKDIDVIGHWRNRPWITQDQAFFDHYENYFTQWLEHQGLDEDMRELFFNQVQQPLIYSCKRDLTQVVKEGDDLPGLSGWKIYEVPGHAGSQIMLYRKKDGIMIGGDHIIGHISSNPLIEPPYIGEETRPRPMLQYNDSLKKCLGYNISTVLPGHGRLVKHTHSLIERRLQRQDERAMKVFGWLKERPMNGYEVCKRLFPTVYEKQLSLTISETIGQLDYLESKDLIFINKENTVWEYTVE